MQSKIDQKENGQVKLLVEVAEEELAADIERAYVKVARQARIPGFRPGKAPRRVLESKLGTGFARLEAINDNAPRWGDLAIVENEVEPIATPSLKVLKGEEEGDVQIEVTVTVRPDVRLDAYGDLTFEFPSSSPSDEDVEAQIERLREALGTLEDSDGEIAEGSVVTLDFTVAGESEGEYTDYVYRIGASEPFAGLKDAVLGKKVADSFEFEVAGDGDEKSTVTGSIKGHQALVKAELNDAFASDVSEFETLDELRKDISDNLESFHVSNLRNGWRSVVANKLAEVAELNVLPEGLVQMEYENISHNLSHRIEAMGLSLNKYLELTRSSIEQISSQIANEAIIESRLDLVLRALVSAEGLEATQEQIDKEVDAIASSWGVTVEEALERLKTSGQLVSVKANLAKRNAIDWLFEHASFVDSKGNALSRGEVTGEIDSADVEIDDEEGDDSVIVEAESTEE
ncbi:MAG: trigger factor [Actinomycetota bacterium]|nr:trigger factor [Actinomycetota bacterium]